MRGGGIGSSVISPLLDTSEELVWKDIRREWRSEMPILHASIVIVIFSFKFESIGSTRVLVLGCNCHP